MVRKCGILQLNGFEPWILPRWLIEMAVDADVPLHYERNSSRSTTADQGAMVIVSVLFSVSGTVLPGPPHWLTAVSSIVRQPGDASRSRSASVTVLDAPRKFNRS